MARPTKYNEQTAQQIAAAIKVGLTDTDAAAVAGVSADSLARWQRRFAGFAELLTRARAERAAYAFAKAREAGQHDWRYWFAFIDRVAPEYRPRAGIELSGAEGGAIEIRGIDLPLPVRTDPSGLDDADADGEATGAGEPLLIPLPSVRGS
jgi:hypothetical protein